MLAGSKGKVIVGLDTDERITQAKGPTRPINSLQDRMFVLSSIRYIDQVVSFSSNAELEAHISTIMPDFMVIGDDYRGKKIIGSQFIKEIYYVSRDDKSTTSIVNGFNL
jgi:D-beta-D-heptose 7-phosphate kinase/D-beta-D-heptose 1-phosphate adenosyltransferase